MNKQPFYHRAVVLFTATEELDSKDVAEAIRVGMHKKFNDKGRELVVFGLIEIEEMDAEPGDPADLM